jgi:chaperone required for assembly of F1-ATPase
MRDIFSDIFADQPGDPTEAARRAVRPQLRGRFYAQAGLGETPDGFQVLLDGRPVRTPARTLLAAPARPLAEAIVAEWQAQRETIDPATMPLTRLANVVIDGVRAARAPFVAEVEKYLGSDLLFYRADAPAGLTAAQARHWDPVLAWAREAFGARFMLAEGVVFVAQPAEAVAAACAAIPDDPWRLGAVNSVTGLTGSGLLALALAYGRLSAEEAWAAGHVDEDWNMATWGRDELALERRAWRFKEMTAAALVLEILRPSA